MSFSQSAVSLKKWIGQKDSNMETASVFFRVACRTGFRCCRFTRNRRLFLTQQS